MNIRKSTLSAAMTALLSMGMVSQAAAYTSAGAKANYEDLSIAIRDSNGTLVTQGVAGTFLFRTTNSASLDGAGGFDTDTCGGTLTSHTCSTAPPVLDSDLITLGTTGHAPNTFTLDGPNAGTEYSYADSVIQTAQLVTGGFTNAGVIAETELLTDGDGGASAVIQSNTGFMFTFTLPQGPGPYSVEVNFKADPDAYAVSDNPGSEAVSAIATLQATINLSEDGGPGDATWTPDGIGTNDCTGEAGGVTCSNEIDLDSLNETANISTDPDQDYHSYIVGDLGLVSYRIHFDNLGAGDWSFGLDTSADTTVIKRVPEPGTLLMLGAGLAGLVAAKRQRRRRQQA